jgi:hypothetical protein
MQKISKTKSNRVYEDVKVHRSDLESIPQPNPRVETCLTTMADFLDDVLEMETQFARDGAAAGERDAMLKAQADGLVLVCLFLSSILLVWNVERRLFRRDFKKERKSAQKWASTKV